MIKRCRFYPSFSEYSKLVLIKNGFFKSFFNRCKTNEISSLFII